MNLIPAIFLGFAILFAEISRVRKLVYIDFLRGVSLSFFVIFVLVPIVIHGIGVEVDQRFYWLSWINYDEGSLSIPAQLTALIGYFSIRFGFTLGWRLSSAARLANKVAISLRRLPARVWLLLALGLALFSLVSLVLYSLRRGAGIMLLLQTAGQIRVGQYVAGIEEASFTFLTYAMQGITATFILLGLLKQSKPGRFWQWRFLLLVLIFSFTAVLSVIVLWMRAGRLHLLNFFLVIMLVMLVWFQSKWGLFRFAASVAVIALVVVITVFGKYLLGVAQSPYIPEAGFVGFVSLLSAELAFPYLSLINAIDISEPYRWFLDIPLAFVYVFGVPLYVLVTGSGPQDLPLSVAKVNTLNILGTTELGEIPVDLVTFGYLSFGISGVVIICFLFGVWISFIERVFPPGAGGVLEVLRVAWIVFISTVGVIYADPVNVLRDGLYVIMPTFVAVWLAVFSPQRKTSEVLELKDQGSGLGNRRLER